MTNQSTCGSKKLMIALCASLAVNVFAVGYVVGKSCHHHHGHHGHHGALHKEHGGKHFGKGQRGERFGHQHGAPFMELFSKEEMKAAKPFIDEQMKKLRESRKTLAAAVKSGEPVSVEAIESHFTQTNAVFEEMKTNLHSKVMDKVRAMTPEERTQFAERLVKKHPKGPRHHHRDGKMERHHKPAGEERHGPAEDEALPEPAAE
jgi:uncharacterized membrane protein